MFILPTFDNLKIRQVPWATLGIILTCIWVFFILQHGDNERLAQLILEYGDNGLLEVEAEAFADFQVSRPEEEHVELPDFKELREYQDKDIRRMIYSQLWWALQLDVEFQNALRKGTAIPPDSPQYENWHDLRRQYSSDIESVLWFSYSFKAAWPTPATAFTSMFLHGDIYHLLGNMIFLFITGMILEAILGSVPFLLVYLVCGMAGTWLTIPFFHTPAIPCLGASGAISSVMGTYSVMVGMRRIPVFLSLGVFFTNMSVPALFLIVIWAGKEAAYYFFFPDSGVNYLAHFFGYLVGGVVGVPLRLWRKGHIRQFFESERSGRDVGVLVGRGVEFLKELRFERARECMLKALEQSPDDPVILQYLFSIDRQTGDMARFRKSAENLFQRMLADKGDAQLLLERYREYVERNGLALNDGLLLALAHRFARFRHYEEMMAIILSLGKKKCSDQRFAAVLLFAVQRLLDEGQKSRASTCAALVLQLFADHPEAELVRPLFKSSARSSAAAAR